MFLGLSILKVICICISAFTNNFFFMCISVKLNVYMCATYRYCLVEVSRRGQKPWNYTYTSGEPTCECQEWNSGLESALNC